MGSLHINHDWTVKWYEMSAQPQPIPDGIRAASQLRVRRELQGAGGGTVGFAILHTGVDAVWLMCDTWHDDILHHRLWRADLSRPTDFTVVDPGGPTACVHELVVISHERNAYVEHVLDAQPADFDAYLGDLCGAKARQRRALLLAFNHAWGTGNVDGLMELMSDDPSYGASSGPEPGLRHRGRTAVRSAFEAVIRDEAVSAQATTPCPPLHDDAIWLDGDRALTPWQYSTLDVDGAPAIVHGVDLWRFDGLRLKSKDAFRKAWPTTSP